MQIFTKPPSPLLAPFVKCFTIIRSTTGGVSTVLASTSVAMACRLQGQVWYEGTQLHPLPAYALSGLRQSAKHIRYAPGAATLVTLFTPLGASAFFPLALNRLYEKTINLSDIVHAEKLTALKNGLSQTENDEDKITVTENFLLACQTGGAGVPAIEEAVRHIHSAKGVLQVKQLASSLHMSQDAFEKAFRKAVGATPKQYAGIVRFHSVLADVQAGIPLTQLAHGASYFDQSHFIREFKAFTGASPRTFRNGPSVW